MNPWDEIQKGGEEGERLDMCTSNLAHVQVALDMDSPSLTAPLFIWFYHLICIKMHLSLLKHSKDFGFGIWKKVWDRDMGLFFFFNFCWNIVDLQCCVSLVLQETTKLPPKVAITFLILTSNE